MTVLAVVRADRRVEPRLGRGSVPTVFRSIGAREGRRGERLQSVARQGRWRGWRWAGCCYVWVGGGWVLRELAGASRLGVESLLQVGSAELRRFVFGCLGGIYIHIVNID